MEIKMIGTGSIGSTSLSACTLIDNEILVDVPNGSIKRMKQLKCNICDIKVILITHLHGDHFLDIPFFMFEKFFNECKEETIIYCPIGTQQKVKEIFEIAFPGDYEKINSAIKITFIEIQQINHKEVLDNTYITSKLVEHGHLKHAYGYIIEKNNKHIGFSGDSKICDSIQDIVENSDISILDTSLPGDGSYAHMGLNDIENLCNKYKNHKIIATHMYDLTRSLANNKKIKNLIIPNDGEIINI